MFKGIALAVFCLTCAACSTRSGLPLGPQAYSVIPVEQAAASPGVYLIGPLDTVSVNVFREPQLSVTNLQVDTGGDLMLPLVGKVHATGESAAGLSDRIQTQLRRYLKHPSVSVSVTSNSQTIAIEGGVTQPGIYPIPGRSSLIEALALARGPTVVAAQDEVLVFRKLNGKRAVARFDMRLIRMGRFPDPEILPGDRIVVGYNGLKEAYVNFISRMPFFSYRVQ